MLINKLNNNEVHGIVNHLLHSWLEVISHLAGQASTRHLNIYWQKSQQKNKVQSLIILSKYF